jgi:hypothetical protein
MWWTVYWGGELYDLWTEREVLDTMETVEPLDIDYRKKVVSF